MMDGDLALRVAFRLLYAEEGPGSEEELQSPKPKRKGPPPKWDDFLKARYQDGKARVPNPNPKTRDQHPQVAFSTALKDKAFMRKVMKEYASWVNRQKKAPSKSPSDKMQAPSEKPVKPKVNAKPLNPDPAEYVDYGRQFDLSKLDEDHRGALRDYSGSHYTSINSYLRNGNPPLEELTEKKGINMKKLEDAFNHVRVPEPVVVSRGVKDDHPLIRLLQAGKLKPGMEVTDKGYMSTSLVPPRVWDWGEITLAISVPKGARGIYLGNQYGGDSISNAPREYELVLDKGTKMRITKVEAKTIHLEVV